MINLQLLQRQRAKLYQNELRKQFEQKQSMKKNQSMQLKSKDQQDLKQKVNVAIQNMKYQKQRDFFIKSKLFEQNVMLSSIKNMNRQIQESSRQQVPLRGANFMDNIYQTQQKRGYNAKNIAKILSHQNHQDQNIHKVIHKQVKNHEMIQDQRHMERLRQTEVMRRKQNQDIRQRHSIEPKNAIQMHKKLQQMNNQYRKSLQSFAYNGRDILDSLKRDESQDIYQRKKRVQSELKNQIQQKKIKDYYDKMDHVGQPDDLKKSILGNVLYKNNNRNAKQYADYLMKQMNENDLRKSYQKQQNKQKQQIPSIFGGQGGPQRVKMMKYIDHNLGIQSEYLRNVQPGNKSNSPFRMSNLYEYNGENSPKKINSQSTYKIFENPQNPQKIHTQAASISDDMNKKISNSIEQNVRQSSSRVGSQSPKTFVSYDFIKGSPKRYEI